MYDINVDDIQKAVKHLKLGNGDGEGSLFSDNIIYAPHILHVFICMLFKAMLVDGTSPVSMIASTMIPIPKVKHLICTSDNFCAITLSTILGKLFDLIILDKEQEAPYTSYLQFGIKAGVSSTQCTTVFKETVNHYNFNKSNDFVLFLDATKLFNRVRYCKPSKELIKRNVSQVVLCLLLDMQTMYVIVLSRVECSFLSSVIFCIYGWPVKTTKIQWVGCYMGNHFMGAIAYADDINLICPTKKSLDILTGICELYAYEFSITFNAKKSIFLVFKGRKCEEAHTSICICENGDKIEKCKCTDHLGH